MHLPICLPICVDKNIWMYIERERNAHGFTQSIAEGEKLPYTKYLRKLHLHKTQIKVVT